MSKQMSQPKAVVLLYPGCIYFEVSAFVARASRTHAIDIRVPESDRVSADGLTILAQGSYAETDLHNADWVVVPGGDPYEVIENTALLNVLQAAQAQQIALGGICNGALVLARAGVLKGRRCTHHCVEKYAPLPEYQVLMDYATPVFAGSQYEDSDVVQDGKIVTAKAHAFEAFAETLLKLV